MKTALFVAWRNNDDIHRGWGPVGRLEHEDGIFRFFYTRGARQLNGFRPFPGMADFNQIYESNELFPLFANRLLSPKRPDYENFLRWGGFSLGSQPDPIHILGVTEGKRATDSVEVFPCPIPDNGCYMNKFFLHGVRWMFQGVQDRIAQLNSDERLYLMPDIQNQYDANAVAVRTSDDRAMIGYVPRYLAHDVRKLFDDCDLNFIQLHVHQVNLDAPLQQRVLCRMRACWPDGFEPCSTEDFHPIPIGVSTGCSQS